MTVLTGKNFDLEVLQSALPVLVLWGAVMDVNSTKIALAMMKLDAAKVKTARVDIDASPDLVMRFSVRQVPLVVLFVAGMALAEDTTLSETLLKQVM
jgi:thioredoxin-like negative regulator of GroEL